MRSPLRLVVPGVLVLAIACTTASSTTSTPSHSAAPTSGSPITTQSHGLKTLKHLIFIVQ